jgi:hypothetical protein
MKDKMRRNSKVLKTKKSDWPLYRRFFILVGAIVIILLATYFIGLAILSQIGTREDTFTQRDRIAPSPPILTGVPQATNSAQLNIKGFAEVGTTVTLFLNSGENDSQLVGAEGQFNFEKVGLELGENEIHTTTTDNAGNESRQSTVYKVVVDQKPPKLEVIEPENGAIVKEEEDKQTFVLVKGEVEEGATVTVNDYQAIVREEGKFEYRLLLTKEDENIIKIIARDTAGNKTTVEKAIIYKKLEEESED